MNVNGIEWKVITEQSEEDGPYDTYTAMIEGSEVIVSKVVSFDGPVWALTIERRDNPDDPHSMSTGYGSPLDATSLTEALIEAVEAEKVVRPLLD